MDAGDGDKTTSAAQRDAHDPLALKRAKRRRAEAAATRARLEAVWNSDRGVKNTAHKTRWEVRGDGTLQPSRGEKKRDRKTSRKVRSRLEDGSSVSQVSLGVGPGEEP